MTLMNTRCAVAVVAFSLAAWGCGDDPLPGLTSASTASDDDSDDDDDGDTETSETLPPSTSATISASETMNTDPTETATGSGSTTDDGSTTVITTGPDTTTTTDPTTEGSSTSSGSSSSTAFDDVDTVCEGPPVDDECDTPSPYDGEGECDPYAQDCDAGEKCMPWADDGGNSWNATRCSLVDAAPAGLGEDCNVEGSGVSGVDNCDVGLMCWAVDPEDNTGTCTELCGCGPDEPTCAGSVAICSISNEGSLPICLPACDPIDLTTCSDNEICVFTQNTFLCVPDASGDEGEAGDPCMFLNACDPGHLCANPDIVPGCPAGAAGCCTEFCDLDTGNSDCSDDEASCEPLFELGEEPEDCHEDTGICIEA